MDRGPQYSAAPPARPVCAVEGAPRAAPPRPIDTLIASLCAQLAAQRQQIAALESLAQSRADDAATLRLMYRQALALVHDLTERERRHQERCRAMLRAMRARRGAAPERGVGC